MRNGGATDVRSVDVPQFLLLRHVLHIRVLANLGKVDRRRAAEENVLRGRVRHQHDRVRVPVSDRGVSDVPVTAAQRGRQGDMRRPVAHPHRAVRRRSAVFFVVAKKNAATGEHLGVHRARAPSDPSVLRRRLATDVQEQ